MAKYPTAIATLAGAGARTHFGTTLVRSWVTEIIAVQADYNNVRGSFSTLATFMNTSRRPDGAFKIFQATHGTLRNVSASQHHNKSHATRHINSASDMIRLSHTGTIFQTGLMTTTQFRNINSWSSTANKTLATAGAIKGSGDTFKSYDIGFHPDFLEVVFSNIGFTLFRGSSPGTDRVLHASLNAVAHGSHLFTTGVTGLTIESYGFQVRTWLNTNDHDGFFFAIKRPE